MTLFRRLVLMVVFLAGIISCEETPVNNTPEYSFLFAENPVMVRSEGGAVSTTIISDISYSVESLSEWICDVKSEDSGTVSFSVSPNSSEATRDGKIAFHINGTEDIKELTVRQAAAANSLSASKGEVAFTTEGGEETLAIKAQSNWEIDSCPEWAKAEKKNAATLLITVTTNFDGKARSGNLVLKTATESFPIVISQEHNGSLFKNASTVMGRKFVYNCGSLITRVTTDKSYTVTDGVEALEIKYMSNITGSELPYYVYIYEIDLNKDVTILATCKNDDASNIKKTDAEETGVQTICKQLAAMKDKRSNLTIYGGINGDFCYGQGSQTVRNSLLHGVMHKDGICLKETFDGGSACSVFAMMDDGKARIIKQSNYLSSKGAIVEAIGGRQIILDGGAITTVKNGKQDPRTAIGVSADRSKVIMLVIDGRQTSHSNGADYPEMGTMFKAMGAYNAINLDGGGSSTFVHGTSSGFETRNKPSNGADRAIPNGLAIVSK